MWAVKEDIGSLRCHPGLLLGEGKAEVCSLERLVPMQQRRAPVSLGGVAGSQLRMYLGFGVLFPRKIQE